MTYNHQTPLQEQTIFAIESNYLNALSHRLRYGFSTRPTSVAGTATPEADVVKNRQYWLAQFGMNTDLSAFTCPTIQVHGTDFARVSQIKHPCEVDAIVVDEAHKPAATFSADCTPVILYAPDVHIGAVLHCGWKSTAQGLAKKMVNELVTRHNTNPTNMVAVIGPALSLDGFEIDADVQNQLAATLNSNYGHLWNRRSVYSPGKFHADVALVNELQLRECGLRRIERLAIHTDTHPHLLWSHRAGDAERQGTFLELLP
jgi:YfiH family protein